MLRPVNIRGTKYTGGPCKQGAEPENNIYTPNVDSKRIGKLELTVMLG